MRRAKTLVPAVLAAVFVIAVPMVLWLCSSPLKPNVGGPLGMAVLDESAREEGAVIDEETLDYGRGTDCSDVIYLEWGSMGLSLDFYEAASISPGAMIEVELHRIDWGLFDSYVSSSFVDCDGIRSLVWNNVGKGYYYFRIQDSASSREEEGESRVVHVKSHGFSDVV